MTTTISTEHPNPGSDAAIKKGCTCPTLDNNHGLGRGDGLFYIEPACKLHGVKND